MVSALLRVYRRDEAGKDGYPPAWHQCPDCNPGDSGCDTCDDYGSIKSLVRGTATPFPGFRCVRCLHPWHPSQPRPHGPEWSPCDEQCTHERNSTAPIRCRPTPVGWPSTAELIATGHTVEARWRILTTHHLTGDKLDCRWWNLAALCQRCHLKIQGRVRMEQVYPHEHSEWFKPYAAGYYAAAYLDENLTREQTMERLDELLALERVA